MAGPFTYKAIIAVLLSISVLFILFKRLKEHLTIRRLGGYAPYVPARAPFGFDLVFRMVYYSKKYRDIAFWHYVFGHCSPSLEDRHSNTIEVRIANNRVLFTADPENIKAILSTQFQCYGKGPDFFKDWKDFLGNGIFNADGQAWHNARSLLRPLFAKTRVSDLEIFEQHTQELINCIGTNGQLVDLADLFNRFTLDTATHYLFGRSVGSLVNADSSFAQAFSEVIRVQMLKIRAGPLGGFVALGTFWESMRAIEAFVEPFIQDILRFSPAELEEQAAKSTNRTFLHSLATYTKDRKVIRDQLINILLAGRDTTASCLSFLFKELSANPRTYAKLRQEILSKIGPTEAPTYDDIMHLQYLQNAINETLRLYPPVPVNIRVSNIDTTLPRGGGKDGLSPVGIPKATPVVYSPMYLHRADRSQYPPISAQFPDIMTFSPERWEVWTPRPWSYIPFNGGPRVCIGQQFAITEIGYTVVRLLQRFERMERYWTEEEDLLKSEIILQPKNGVKVGVWEAGVVEGKR
ncbi:MAG: hypothetical protein Q9218_005337 [Villophora microphyllina]